MRGLGRDFEVAKRLVRRKWPWVKKYQAWMGVRTAALEAANEKWEAESEAELITTLGREGFEKRLHDRATLRESLQRSWRNKIILTACCLPLPFIGHGFGFKIFDIVTLILMILIWRRAVLKPAVEKYEQVAGKPFKPLSAEEEQSNRRVAGRVLYFLAKEEAKRASKSE